MERIPDSLLAFCMRLLVVSVCHIFLPTRKSAVFRIKGCTEYVHMYVCACAVPSRQTEILQLYFAVKFGKGVVPSYKDRHSV